MTPIFDPRAGDAEDDASSTKSRSLLAIAGTLLGEINLPKLVLAWTLLVLLPGLALGLAPLLAGTWFHTLADKVEAIAGLWTALLLALVALVGLLGWRPLLRAAELGFWSLNSLAVQPGYALFREGLRHLVELLPFARAGDRRREVLRAATAAGGGLLASLLAIALVALAWPSTRWTGEAADLRAPLTLVMPALANMVVLVGAYLAAASLAWGVADATMGQPRDLPAFDPPPADPRRWRVVHLSDIHVVGERFGFRIESGRAGPRGNVRLAQVLARLEAMHAQAPLDLVLITGDMTDAGRSAEWAEFLVALARHPAIAARTLILPGNHDVNIVDRANPARLDLPTSPGKRLRQMRTLSTMAAVQGDRVRVLDRATRALGPTLSEALAPHRAAITEFADAGSLRLTAGLARLWADAFPLVLPPAEQDGLGVVLLNSNAEAHFSFTNALGLIPAEDARALLAVLQALPRARWIVALHHHLVEYPQPAHAFSERIGTALINGSWFLRLLAPQAGRLVAMHGHRHIDWIGECAGVRIISAPSPVMEATDAQPTRFHLHTLAPAPEGRLALLPNEAIDMPGGVTEAAHG